MRLKDHIPAPPREPLREPFRECRERGFSLIETLIAALLLGLTALGLSALQVWSLAAANQIRFHHQALNHALEISERIRANPASASAYLSGAGTHCDPVAAGAAADLGCWHAALRRTLPAGAGTIALSSDTPRLLAITIRWARRMPGAAADADPDANAEAVLRWSTRL